MPNIAQNTSRLLKRTLAFSRAGRGLPPGHATGATLVTGGPPPDGSGHEGPRRSCRAPPSAGSTWAVAHRAGPRPRAKHASSGTREHMATSPGPALQSPPAWSRFRTPSLSLEGPGIGVGSAADVADPLIQCHARSGPGEG